MFGSRIDSNTTKSKYSEACLESPPILPPTSGLKRQVVSQNSLLYGLYRKGTKYVGITKEGEVSQKYDLKNIEIPADTKDNVTSRTGIEPRTFRTEGHRSTN
jgi:hypothetical protein